MHIVHTRSDFDVKTDGLDDVVDPTTSCVLNGAYCGLSVVGILFHIGSENNTVMDVSHISFKTSYS